MGKISAGLVMYCFDGKLKVFLAHLGGPFFKNKDDGAWGIPKGEINEGEDKTDLLSVAKREFEEETGIKPNGEFLELGSVKKKDGKVVYFWAFENNGKARFVKSSLFEIEWPPKSGNMEKFPEVDDARFFEIGVARKKIHPYQKEILDILEEKVMKNKKLSVQQKLF